MIKMGYFFFELNQTLKTKTSRPCGRDVNMQCLFFEQSLSLNVVLNQKSFLTFKDMQTITNNDHATNTHRP